MFEPFIEFFEPFIDFVTADYYPAFGVPARTLAEGIGQWLYLVVALIILSVLSIKGKELVSYLWDKWGF